MQNHIFPERVRVWDLPTRLFHLLLIVVISGLIITGELGGSSLELHSWFGYITLTLILFRILWGVFGGYWSRFTNFVPTPSTLVAYVRSHHRDGMQDYPGHNPLGALSVLAMLFVVLIQVLSGFMTDDDISFAGPWVSYVPGHWVSVASEYHGDIGKVILIFLIVLHVAFVLFYKFSKGKDLISPMLSGDKEFTTPVPPSRDTTLSRFFAILMLSGSGYLVYRIVALN